MTLFTNLVSRARSWVRPESHAPAQKGTLPRRAFIGLSAAALTGAAMGLSACGQEPPPFIEQPFGQIDGGVLPDAEVIDLPSGARIVATINGNRVELPLDENGNLMIPLDIFTAAPETTGSHLTATGGFIELQTPTVILQGTDLDRISGLVIVIATDSTLVSVTNIAGEPQNLGCLDGVIDTTQIAADDGRPYCSDPEMSPYAESFAFLVCPSNPDNRIKLFLAGAAIERFSVRGGQATEEVMDRFEVNASGDNLDRIGVDCLPGEGEEVNFSGGNIPQPYQIAVPTEWFTEPTELAIRLRFTISVDSRQIEALVPENTYTTRLKVSLMSQGAGD